MSADDFTGTEISRFDSVHYGCCVHDDDSGVECMTGKELREIARAVLADQLKASDFDSARANAAIQALHAPVDPDEEREAHRLHVEGLNAMNTSPIEMHTGPLGVDRQFRQR
jgi:hypothetical protein